MFSDYSYTPLYSPGFIIPQHLHTYPNSDTVKFEGHIRRRRVDHNIYQRLFYGGHGYFGGNPGGRGPQSIFGGLYGCSGGGL